MEYLLIVMLCAFVGIIVFPDNYMEVAFLSIIWPVTFFTLAIAIPVSLVMALGWLVRASVECLWNKK